MSSGKTHSGFGLTHAFLLSLIAVSVLWVLKSTELMFGWKLTFLGVHPHDISALTGIVTAPFIHGSLEHLFNNTLPILLLGTGLLYGYHESRWKVLTFVWIFSGLGVWFFAREAWHIGASGLTHGVFFYLFVVSILRRDKSSIAIMMVAFFLYGGMTMTIFPREEGVSFEYHFFGALAGLIAAFIWQKDSILLKEKVYPWEGKDEEDPVIGDQWKLDR